jgi:cytochrome c biogenesis protein
MASAQSSSSLTGAPKASETTTSPSALNENAIIDDASSEWIESEKKSSAEQSKSSGVGGAIDGFLNLISSVPFGIILLILLITACMIGMLIQQQELETFAAYYAGLTPAEKLVYGWLGFFNIYKAKYFVALLVMLSLNIILASIDHFPAALSFITRKKLTASPTFAMAQKFKEKVELPNLDRNQLVDRVKEAARAMRFKVRVTEEESRTTVFAERGVWNRLGAYAVHVGLLTIFLGGFITGFTSETGMMPVVPDESSDRMTVNEFNVDRATTQFAVGQRELTLPFTVEGVDIQQKLIKKEGGLDAGNTLDWLTRVRILDHETGKTTEALVHMNNPFDYRGYRFFQASYRELGNAREIRLSVTPTGGGAAQEVTIKRNGEAALADGTRLKYFEFNPHFVLSRDGEAGVGSTGYENPAAHLRYVKPDGKQGDFWVFTQDFINEISNAPFLKSKLLNTEPYQFVLTDFEKAPLAHILSIQYDQGAKIVYLGFGILCLTLIGVFFFSHQRLWIVVEDGVVYLGGNANRNRLSFEDRAKNIIEMIRK